MSDAGKLIIESDENSSLYALSTKSHYSFVIDGENWPTVYHYLIANMFEGLIEGIRWMSIADIHLLTIPQTIITRSGEHEIVYGGRKKYKIRPDWDVLRKEFLLLANREKIRQNANVKKVLLKTDTHGLVDKNDKDNGFILETIRHDLRANDEYGDTIKTKRDLKAIFKEDVPDDRPHYFTEITNQLRRLIVEIISDEGADTVYLGIVEDAIYTFHYDTLKAYNIILNIRKVIESPLTATFIREEMPNLEKLTKKIKSKLEKIQSLNKAKVPWDASFAIAFYLWYIQQNPNEEKEAKERLQTVNVELRYLPEKRYYRDNLPKGEPSILDIIRKQNAGIKKTSEESSSEKSSEKDSSEDSSSEDSDEEEESPEDSKLHLKEVENYVIAKTSSRSKKFLKDYEPKLLKYGAVKQEYMQTFSKGLTEKKTLQVVMVLKKNAKQKAIKRLLKNSNYSVVNNNSYKITGDLKSHAHQLYLLGARYKVKKVEKKTIQLVKSSDPGDVNLLSKGGYYNPDKGGYVFLFYGKIPAQKTAKIHRINYQKSYAGLAIKNKNAMYVQIEDASKIVKYIEKVNSEGPLRYLDEWLEKKVKFMYEICVIVAKVLSVEPVTQEAVKFSFYLVNCPKESGAKLKWGSLPKELMKLDNFDSQAKSLFDMRMSRLFEMLKFYVHWSEDKEAAFNHIVTLKSEECPKNAVYAAIHIYETFELYHFFKDDEKKYAIALNCLCDKEDNWDEYVGAYFKGEKKPVKSAEDFVVNAVKVVRGFTIDAKWKNVLVLFHMFVGDKNRLACKKIIFFSNFFKSHYNIN
ncbi:MAG TPA: NADAR family protein [Nitrosarchaeum sp.]|nr:NADAR family protein [Nitrosarchaeum sp.]